MTTPPGVTVVDDADLRIGTGRTRRFVGREHGAGVSYFHVDAPPGDHPGLHRHPYTETWVVLEGHARIHAGDEQVEVAAGQTATIPPHTWHEFVALGPGRLRMLCIHASAEIVQEFLDPDDA